MKKLPDEPRKLALITAGYISGFLILILWIVMEFLGTRYSIDISVWLVISVGIIAGIFAYFVINYMVRNYIGEKVRLIYKTIRTSKLPLKGDTSFAKSSLDKVNQEVIAWSKSKTEEIEELKKMAEYRREFLGNISHELKTPVFNIQGYLLTLLDGAINDEEVNKQYLLRAEKNIERIIMIINDLVKISELESGQLKPEYSRFELTELTHEVMDLLADKASAKNINLSLLQPYEQQFIVRADKQRIKDVLINLIDNAIKYSNPKGRIRISFYVMDSRILTEVTDDGPGIDAHDLPRIFERFYRVDKSRTRTDNNNGGTGLGLAIVKHIIEAHEEQINVRSTKGVGTTFAFTLKKAN